MIAKTSDLTLNTVKEKKERVRKKESKRKKEKRKIIKKGEKRNKEVSAQL